MKKYKIKSGDTLGSIAFKQLGATAKWREIAELNDIVNPNKIKVGQMLQLPIIGEPETSTQKSDVVIIDENPKIYFQYQDDPTKRYLGKNSGKAFLETAVKTRKNLLKKTHHYFPNLRSVSQR